VQASLFDVDPTVDESFILKPFFFAKFRSNLSAKFSSMVGSPSKGIGDPLELKPVGIDKDLSSCVTSHGLDIRPDQDLVTKLLRDRLGDRLESSEC
jgi:hypothetical protein